MIIKPECDVESAEDFARYYNASYMESREGKVLQVVGHHGASILLRDHSAVDPEQEHVLLPWRRVQKDLVYGRPPGGLFELDGRVVLMYMQNNRQAGRGFRAEYFKFFRLRTEDEWRPGAAMERLIAPRVYNPERVNIAVGLSEALRNGVDKILDQDYATVYQGGEVRLYRRFDRIGTFRNDGGKLCLLDTFKFTEPHIRDNLRYVGEIQYVAA